MTGLRATKTLKEIRLEKFWGDLKSKAAFQR